MFGALPRASSVVRGTLQRAASIRSLLRGDHHVTSCLLTIGNRKAQATSSSVDQPYCAMGMRRPPCSACATCPSKELSVETCRQFCRAFP